MYQVVGDLSISIRNRIKKVLRIEEDSLSEKIYKTLITFHLVAFAWIFFRSNGILAALRYIYHMIKSCNAWVIFDGTLLKFNLASLQFLIIGICLILVLVVEGCQKKGILDLRKKILNLHVFLRWIVLIAIILIIVCFGVYGPGYNASDFIYGGF